MDCTDRLRWSIVAVLAASYIAFGCPDAMLPGGASYAVRASVYPLFHANLWHLVINCVAVWGMFAPGRWNWRDVLAASLISFLVYPLSFRPVVGMSNLIYATIGLRTPAFSSRWWKSRNVIIFVAVTCAMAFIPQFSATTHIAAFVVGVIVSLFRRRINKIYKEAGL